MTSEYKSVAVQAPVQVGEIVKIMGLEMLCTSHYSHPFHAMVMRYVDKQGTMQTTEIGCNEWDGISKHLQESKN